MITTVASRTQRPRDRARPPGEAPIRRGKRDSCHSIELANLNGSNCLSNTQQQNIPFEAHSVRRLSSDEPYGPPGGERCRCGTPGRREPRQPRAGPSE
eukprot:766574-Hanusia_phi.AAC.7